MWVWLQRSHASHQTPGHPLPTRREVPDHDLRTLYTDTNLTVELKLPLTTPSHSLAMHSFPFLSPT